MVRMDEEKEFLSVIKRNYKSAKNVHVSEPLACAGAIRTVLETTVKLFWWKKYNKVPVWIDKNGKETFILLEAINSEKFASYFNKLIVSDMHAIRQMCNDILHGEADLDVGTAQELLIRLEQCVNTVQHKIGLKLVETEIKETEIIERVKELEKEEMKTYKKSDVNAYIENKKEPIIAPTNAEAERNVFWKMFNAILDENGNPFHIKSRRHYATINRNSPNCNLCLSLDFLITKGFLRIGIYINDDIKTPHFERLLAMRDEIEKGLGFKPIWNRIGVQNSNTRRIEVQLPFKAYDHEDYIRLIETALPKIMKFIEVFSAYLPEIFQENKEKKGGTIMITMNNILTSDIDKDYGGTAQVIYDEGCRVFDWDSSKRYLFGKQKILYAKDATPEHYSVWFLTHNNWTDTKGGKWYNTIIWDKDKKEYVIEEMWRKFEDEKIENDIRLTFAKNKNQKYIFLGLYQCREMKKMKLREDIDNIKAGEIVLIKTYTLVSKQYVKQEKMKSEWVFRKK